MEMIVFGGLLFVAPLAAQTGSPAAAQYPGLPSETPTRFEAATESFDYVKRDVMIPMRDGVKLHTVILVPKGAKGATVDHATDTYDTIDWLVTNGPETNGHVGVLGIS